MKAWILNDINNICFTDTDIPLPSENEVLIQVKTVGICGSDIPRIYGTGAHNMPLIPGHEFSGIVEGVGKNADPSLLKKRVAVFPKITYPSSDSYNNYDYLGSRRNGAFAEYVTVPADNILLLPDDVTFEEAAMMEPLAVAANAVRTGTKSVSCDSPIAVCGLGTIGLMVVMLLIEAGYNNIYAIGNKDSQKNNAFSLGIAPHCFIDSRNENVSEQLNLVSKGVSVFFECVGKNECIAHGIESASLNGHLVLIGNPYSDMLFSKDTYWQILRKQLTVHGIWNSFFSKDYSKDCLDDWHYSLALVAQKKIPLNKLISHRFNPSELEKALHIMRDKTEDYCKILISFED